MKKHTYKEVERVARDMAILWGIPLPEALCKAQRWFKESRGDDYLAPAFLMNYDAGITCQDAGLPVMWIRIHEDDENHYNDLVARPMTRFEAFRHYS